MNYIAIDIETTGLMPYYDSQITCICAKDSHGEEFAEVGCDEVDIIKRFLGWLIVRDKGEYMLISKNGKKFDIPFIIARCSKHSFDYKVYMPLLEYGHFDLQLITKKWVSLDDWAKMYCLPIGKLSNGFEAIKMFQERRFDDLVKYCRNDVIMLEQIYKLYKWMQNGNHMKILEAGGGYSY